MKSVLLILLLCFVACGKTGTHKKEEVAADDVNAVARGATEMKVDEMSGGEQQRQLMAKQVNQSIPKARMIIKIADLAMEIDKYDEAMTQIQMLTEQAGGYISNSITEIPYENVKRGTVNIRIPAVKFESVAGELKKLAKKIESEGVRGEDVTEEFYDLEARLENKRRTEKRFQEILRSANTVKEILDVEREISNVREEIDRFEGRKKFLLDQTGMSTINLTIHEPYPLTVSSSGGFWATIGEGFEDGFSGFAVTLSGLITFLIAGIPVFAAIFIVVFILVKWYRRSKTKHQAEKKS
ncbi:DUF4349 domain-containing protein [bacterium]|nr:DUF4349 domain-containing protein [bacterium]